jgi:hypothetical protein
MGTLAASATLALIVVTILRVAWEQHQDERADRESMRRHAEWREALR